MKFLRIRDWDKYQHYKKRKPPWIKLYTDLLRDYKFEQLQNDSMLLSILLCLLASQMDNKIPADEKYLGKHLPMHGKVKLQPLIDAGLIELFQDDSVLPADCAHVAIPETETETDKERETKKETYNEFCKLTDKEHAKLVEQFGETGAADRITNLANYVGSKGVKYKSHYRTILMWEGKNNKSQSPTPDLSNCLTHPV